MKKVLIAVVLSLLAACTPSKKATKNVWKAQKVTFSAPGFIPPAPRGTTKTHLKK